MCLITTKNIPEIAQEDIVCYKYYIVEKKDGKEKLTSPYYGVSAPNLNKTVSTKLDRISSPTGFDIINDSAYYAVQKGFHSFKYLKHVIQDIETWKDIRTRIEYPNYKVFKCIIPKGTKYYEGIFGEVFSYCSKSIKLIELVKTCI